MLETPRPECHIHSISSIGLVDIEFNSPMYIPDFLVDIPTQKELATYQDWSSTILEVVVIPSGYESPEKLLIKDFSIESFDEFKLTLQVDFENPNLISNSKMAPDFLKIVLLKPMLFVDQINNKTIDEKKPLEHELPS